MSQTVTKEQANFTSVNGTHETGVAHLEERMESLLQLTLRTQAWTMLSLKWILNVRNRKIVLLDSQIQWQKFSNVKIMKSCSVSEVLSTQYTLVFSV